jgi:DNA primase
MSKASRFVDFRAVKSAVGMLQVLERYGLAERLTREGESLSGPCPIKGGEGAPQFRADLERNCWGCSSPCRCGGSVLDFVARMERKEPAEAANLLVEWFGLDVASLNAGQGAADAPQAGLQGIGKKAPVPAEGTAPRPAGTGRPNRALGFRLELDPSHPYLAERGLAPETVAEFDLGYCARGLMGGRIAVPIHGAGGELVGYAGRWPGEPPEGSPRWLLPRGFDPSSEVFSLRRALAEPAGPPLVLVAGLFDAMAVWQLGHRRVAALMGPSMSPAQAALVAGRAGAGGAVVLVAEGQRGGPEGSRGVPSPPRPLDVRPPVPPARRPPGRGAYARRTGRAVGPGRALTAGHGRKASPPSSEGGLFYS